MHISHIDIVFPKNYQSFPPYYILFDPSHPENNRSSKIIFAITLNGILNGIPYISIPSDHTYIGMKYGKIMKI